MAGGPSGSPILRKPALDHLIAAFRNASRFGLWLGGLLVLAAALVIGVDVVIRKLFAVSLGGADELAGFALAIGTAWSLGATLLDRAHIRIDSLYLLFPLKLRAILDLLALLAFTVVFGLIFWHGIGVMTQSITAGSRSMSGLETPLVLPQGAWLLGLALFLATALLLLLRALASAVRGEFGAVVHAIGVKTVAEEADEEIRSAEEVRARDQERSP